MTRSRIAAIVLVAAAIVVWTLFGTHRIGTREPNATAHRTISPALVQQLDQVRRAAGLAPPPPASKTVTISGSVIDQLTHNPVPGVEVVFRGPLGESTTIAGTDGNYSIVIERGVYRAFVRDANVLSVGPADRVRLPVGPRAETAGVPDEGLMPVVIANADTAHVELGVWHAGTISGRVIDRLEHPIARAIVRARNSESGTRPTLATDIAESDADGNFELRVAPGDYALDASHPSFAGVAAPIVLHVDGGAKTEMTVMLAAGCIISGHVVRADGTPGGDGAIEKQFGDLDSESGPSGRVEPDGTFRWVTTEEDDVTLRAWPWKSAPSQFRKFACHEGARFPDVVFTLPDREPAVVGTLVDAAGAPVAFAYVDLQPLDPGGLGQQERTDAEGKFEVYDMPHGRYQVEAQVPRRGIVDTTIVVPQQAFRLQLGGTGRIAGTTTDLVDGTLAVAFQSCDGISNIAHEPRLVMVTGGRFTIDDAPACTLELAATWRGRTTLVQTTVDPNDTAHVEIPIGPRRLKQVHGQVTDLASRPVEGAIVRVVGGDDGDEVDVSHTDPSGHYSVKAFSGAQVFASGRRESGTAMVGDANVPDEQVDIVVENNDQ